MWISHAHVCKPVKSFRDVFWRKFVKFSGLFRVISAIYSEQRMFIWRLWFYGIKRVSVLFQTSVRKHECPFWSFISQTQSPYSHIFIVINIDCSHSAVWDARWSSESTNFTYKISICDTISNCGSQSSVCRNTSENHASNIGSKTEQLNITEERKELYLRLTGEKCESDQNVYSKTVINFKCGRTLVIYSLLNFFVVKWNWQSCYRRLCIFIVNCGKLAIKFFKNFFRDLLLLSR